MIAACALTGAAVVVGALVPALPESVLAYEQAVLAMGPRIPADRLATLRASALAEAAAAEGRSSPYLYGQIALLDGMVSAAAGRTADAEGSFEQALEFGERATRLAPTSEHHRVVADAYLQLLRVRAMPYRIANAGRARRAADEAVSLDRDNPRALLAAASFYASTPGIAGGDLDRARQYLDHAYTLTAGNQTLRFVCLVWQAIVAHARSEPDRAARRLEEAGAIYPGSAWYAQTRQEILGR